MSQEKKVTKTFRSKANSLMPKVSSRALQSKFFNAIFTRNVPEINMCLDRNVNPNKINQEFGVAPLHLLAERNDFTIGYRLFEHKKVDLNLKTLHGFAALHLACMMDCRQFVLILLQNNADPNIRDRMGKTPLHWAVERDNYRTVLRLLKSGAKPNVLDSFKNTPLSKSILDVNNLLLAKTLIQHGANMEMESFRSLHIFFESVLNCHCINQIDFVILLIENGVDVNLREESTGRNCLHFVAVTGYLELAIVLVERGAKWNAVDKSGRSPSKVAFEHGNLYVADYFRKGYRPPHILTALPLLFLWSNKLKSRLEDRRAAEEQIEKETKPKRKTLFFL